MRKIKATLGLLALTGLLATSSVSNMNYGAVLAYSGNPNANGAGVVLGVGATIACLPFAGPAALACGLAAVGFDQPVRQ